MRYEFKITPTSKPRMTQRDKWVNRDCVTRYWMFKDFLILQAKKLKFIMPESGYHLKFYIPMPKSWSKKKQSEMMGKPHQGKPDKDNLEKAFLDALCKDDSYIWDGRVSKFWWNEGRIVVNVYGEVTLDEYNPLTIENIGNMCGEFGEKFEALKKTSKGIFNKTKEKI